MVAVFKDVGERYATKNCRPVSLLSVVSKVFEKLVNIGLLRMCAFSDFKYDFRFS